LSTLSNDDTWKVNIKKLKKYQHNDTLVVIMTNVVTVQKKSKSRWNSHDNDKFKGLPWIDSKLRLNEPRSLLWTNIDCIEEIKWLPISEPRFKEDMPRKCKNKSRKRRYNHKSRTPKQLFSHKYVPIAAITPSVRKKIKEIWLL
jgi:hypothetical protein